MERHASTKGLDEKKRQADMMGQKVTRPQRPYYGLYNEGATSDLNSVLQVLFMTPEMHDRLDPKLQPDHQLRKIFEELKEKTCETRNITTAFGIQNVWEQRDAAERLELILSKISQPASEVFQGQLKHITKCSEGHSIIEETKPFRILPLALKDTHDTTYSVKKNFERIFQTKSLTGDKKVFCNGCNSKTRATSGCEMVEAPQILTLLRRFDFDSITRSNVTSTCGADVPLTLQIQNKKYKLYGMVHLRGNQSYKYYTATVLSNEDNTWYECDNPYISKVKEQPFERSGTYNSSNVHLLMYRAMESQVSCDQEDGVKARGAEASSRQAGGGEGNAGSVKDHRTKTERSHDGNMKTAASSPSSSITQQNKPEMTEDDAARNLGHKMDNLRGQHLDRETETDKRKQTVTRPLRPHYGLYNWGATSHLSSVLQVLFMTPEMHDRLDPKLQTDHELRKIFEELKEKTCETRSIRTTFGITDVYGQHTAAECLGLILSKISQPASEVFRGVFTHITKCSEGHSIIEETKPFWTLLLSLRDTHDTTYSVKNNFERIFQTLAGDKKVFCNTCNRTTETTSRCEMVEYPQILTLHLKRFEFDSNTRSNVTSTCGADVPLTLQIQNKKYKLYGMVHLMGSQYHKYYTATVLSNEEDTWYECNNAYVTKVEEQLFARSWTYNSSNVHLLMYRAMESEMPYGTDSEGLTENASQKREETRNLDELRSNDVEQKINQRQRDTDNEKMRNKQNQEDDVKARRAEASSRQTGGEEGNAGSVKDHRPKTERSHDGNVKTSVYRTTLSGVKSSGGEKKQESLCPSGDSPSSSITQQNKTKVTEDDAARNLGHNATWRGQSLDRETETDKKKQRVTRPQKPHHGLYNWGATSHLSSVLQVLFMTPEMHDRLDPKLQKDHQLRKIFEELKEKTCETQSITTTFGIQNGYGQHTAADCLGLILHQIGQPASEVFRGEFTHITKCSVGHSIKEEPKPFWTLLLSLKDTHDTTYSVKNNFERIFQTLAGDKKVFCNTCNRTTETTSRCEMVEYPQILTLHLKRFEFDSITRSNVTSTCCADVPLTLQIKNKKYKLYGMVNNIGGQYYGRYTAFILSNEENTWYECDGYYVSEIREQPFARSGTYNSRNVHLLMYRAIESPINSEVLTDNASHKPDETRNLDELRPDNVHQKRNQRERDADEEGKRKVDPDQEDDVKARRAKASSRQTGGEEEGNAGSVKDHRTKTERSHDGNVKTAASSPSSSITQQNKPEMTEDDAARNLGHKMDNLRGQHLDRETETDKRKQTVTRPLRPHHGLYNQGATSDLNSVLQVLFMTPEMHDRLDPKLQTDFQLRKIFEELKEKPCETQAFTTEFGITDVHGQYTAAECLEWILALISQAASEVFQGQLKHITKCSKGHSINEETKPFCSLPLSLKDTHDTTYSVKKNFEKIFQTLAGDKKVFCNKCNRTRETTSGCEMVEAPQILTLLLKRFDFDYNTRSDVKSNCRVDVPLTLKIKNKKYKLYAMVNHMGDLRGRDYTATILSSEDNTWYECNDENVYMVKEQPFAKSGTYNSRSVYLLMYRVSGDEKKQESLCPSGDSPSSSVTQQKKPEVTEDDAALNLGQRNDNRREQHLDQKKKTDNKKQRVTPTQAPHHHGLYNQGATCYLNSVLQVLFMTPEMHDRLNPKLQPDHQLRKIFKELKERTCETRSITTTFGIQNVCEQRDAAECLELILPKIGQPASEVFQGELKHITKCSEGHSIIEETKPFWTLPLSLKDIDDTTYSVKGSFDRIFQTKSFGGNKKVYCNDCDNKTEATSGCEMVEAPQILTLLLKRFDFDYNTMSHVKSNCLVDVPLSLQIKSKKYKLYGMVNHMGSLRGGHYTATTLSNEDNTWYECNDSSVREVYEQPFAKSGTYNSRSVYLLMYRAMESQESCENNSEGLTDNPSQKQDDTRNLRERDADNEKRKVDPHQEDAVKAKRAETSSRQAGGEEGNAGSVKDRRPKTERSHDGNVKTAASSPSSSITQQNKPEVTEDDAALNLGHKVDNLRVQHLHRETETDKKKQTVTRPQKPYYGLYNQGATSDLNSVLQVLFMTPEMHDRLDPKLHKDFQLRKIFEELKEKPCETRSITTAFGITDVCEQRDAAKCLELILHQISRPASEVFQGWLTDIIKCNRGHDINEETKSFCSLSLSLKDTHDTTYSVKNNFERIFQTLAGDKKVFCNTCNRTTETTSGCEMVEYPQILTLHLKRFELDSNTRSHVTSTCRADVPLTLQIKDKKYKLYGMVNLICSQYYKYYTATVLSNEGNTWYECYNDYVTEIRQQPFARSGTYNSSNVHLLMYRAMESQEYCENNSGGLTHNPSQKQDDTRNLRERDDDKEKKRKVDPDQEDDVKARRAKASSRQTGGEEGNAGSVKDHRPKTERSHDGNVKTSVYRTTVSGVKSSGDEKKQESLCPSGDSPSSSITQQNKTKVKEDDAARNLGHNATWRGQSLDRETETNKKKQRVTRPQRPYYGLCNEGATSDLNSVLQVLFMTPEIHDRLDPKLQPDHQLRKIFEELKEKTCETRSVRTTFGITDGYGQHTAAECLELILSKISQPASEVFQGLLKHITKCSVGHSIIEETKPFWTLLLSLKDIDDTTYSVKKNFERFFQTKSLTGDHKVFCNTCRRTTEARSGCEMVEYPQILTLHLKRFYFDNKTRSYVTSNCCVDVPLTLKIKDKKYKLYGMVNHNGNRHYGHYTATILSDEDNTWYECNDEKVTKAKEQPFAKSGNYNSKIVYLLMYRECEKPFETNQYRDEVEHKRRRI